jgi:uncharacterized protein
MAEIVAALVLLVVVPPADPNARVHDHAGLLSADQRASLEQLTRDIEQRTTAQVAVVTVNSLDGQTIEAYANELFNSWGIGQREANNGVLFLIAPRQRRMRFEVGFGLEPLLTDRLCGEIRDTHVIPRFRENDYPAGIIAGTQQLVRALERNPQAARGIPGSGPLLLRTPKQEAFAATLVVGAMAATLAVAGLLLASRRLYSTATFVALSLAALCALVIAVYFIGRLPKQDPALLVTFGGTGLATAAAWGYNVQKYRRFGPHGCSKCSTHLALLSELQEDPKLSAVQQLEETIGSVDYDVWVCPACLNNDTERYIRPFSGFSDCTACQVRAYKEDSPKVITPASTVSAGKARIDGRCVSCNHKTVRFVVLPRIVPSTTSSGGGSSGGFSGGGGGGGGFGGGGSGGGGASGGW